MFRCIKSCLLRSVCIRYGSKSPLSVLQDSVYRNSTVSRYVNFHPRNYRLFVSTSQLCQRLSQKVSDVTSSSDSSQDKLYDSAPADLSVEKYHKLADSYLSELEERLHILQENDESIDFEFSAGVLTLTLPPKGIYVLNKQPPNKQIWLASPVTGPKRYDFVNLREEQNAQEPDGSCGEWIYLRDGSTLSDLLREECNIDMKGINEIHN